MSVIIRRATKEDATQATPLIYEAIGDIANHLTGESDSQMIISELSHLFNQEDNRHSFLNTYIAADEEEITKVLGILVIYSGKDAIALDDSLKTWLLKKNVNTAQIDREAHVDEFYVDTICVHDLHRGRGIGTTLLHFAEEVAKLKGYKKISLNVEIEKVRARQLYEDLGYEISEPWTIIGEPFHHMVKNI